MLLMQLYPINKYKPLVLVLALILCSSSILYTQNFNTDEQTIYVKQDDLQIKATALNSGNTIQPKNELDYYCYFKNSIITMQGGYVGQLLNGKYEVFFANHALKEQGFFKSGLKHGEWKSWRENGKLKLIEEWSEGKKNGKFTEFNEKGEIAKEGIYKNNLLSGTLVLFEKGELKEEKEYKNGVLKEKKQKPQKESKPDSIPPNEIIAESEIEKEPLETKVQNQKPSKKSTPILNKPNPNSVKKSDKKPVPPQDPKQVTTQNSVTNKSEPYSNTVQDPFGPTASLYIKEEPTPKKPQPKKKFPQKTYSKKTSTPKVSSNKIPKNPPIKQGTFKPSAKTPVSSNPQAKKTKQVEGNYHLIVGTFSEKTNAQKRLKESKALGFNHASIKQYPGDKTYKVVIAFFENLETAAKMEKEVENKFGLSAFVKKAK